MPDTVYDALDIGLERFTQQVKEFEALVNENNVVSDVLQSIYDNEDWTPVERIFWAFQFGYLLRVHADHGPNSAPDVDENRGYQ